MEPLEPVDCIIRSFRSDDLPACKRLYVEGLLGGKLAEKPATGSAKVTVDAALVRDAPSTAGTMVQRLTRGTKVEIFGVAGNWYHVHFGDGDAQTGWIFKTNVGK